MTVLGFLLEKEFRQFFRNPFLSRMVVGFPLMVMLLLPWVTTMDIRHVGVVVVDNDCSQASQRMIQKIGASDYLTLHAVTDSYQPALAAVEAGDADVILEIPDRFERGLTDGSPEGVSISANGVNALKGGIGSQYVSAVIASALSELRSEAGQLVPADTVLVQNRYNPTLDYRRFMLPALMAMLLIILCGFLPALNLVSEKEIGTIEQINVTPVGKFTFTLAKLIPFWVGGFVVLTVAMLIAWGVYGLVPNGSIGAIYLASGLLILTMSVIGATVANYSSTMQQSMFVMFFVVMICMLMSGLFTPIESMPQWAQKISWFVPPAYFIDAMRAAYLKGAEFGELWRDYAALGAFAVVIGLWAAYSYRKQA